ncbi:hypothetical protein KQ940_10190 [Marinobacterium sp. D7]|uniref:hypothetical protein n=1 Tax=Marinobacterium ramblicola TaxID=2849041 RepID=UPI001C2D0109|nr:hypothetical protein [Marinobacterium ramblicola]MBV1788426.1 hypothetical protein [Marinobacterium ramblicola]
MIDKRLAFELFTTLLLLTLGTALVMQSLPGWGLISVALLVGGLSLVLRTVPLRVAAE